MSAHILRFLMLYPGNVKGTQMCVLPATSLLFIKRAGVLAILVIGAERLKAL